MIFRGLLAGFFLTLIGISAGAQTHADVMPLWDELSARWSANDMPGAVEASNKLVEALEPVATDFSMGIQMNSALHNRASLRYNVGDYLGAEEDLKRSVEQARSIKPPAGVPAQAAPQMMVMVDDRVRISLRGLTNFYLAAGDLERATESFQEALKIVPLWKAQAENNPSIGYQILAAEISSMEGTFYRATGDYAKAAQAFLTRLEEIDGAWGMVLKMVGGTESDFTDQMKMNYLRGRANLLMELAEVSSLTEKHKEAVGFCKQARESSAQMMPLYRKWAETTLKTNPAMPKETIEKTLEGVQINSNYLIFERAAIVFRAAGEEKAALDLMVEGIKRRGEDFEQQRMLTLEYNVIRPEESLQLIGDLQAILGQHDEAAVSYEKALKLIRSQYPESHPADLEIRESQALLEKARGDDAAAAKIASEVLAGRMKNLEAVLSFADESQRLAYRSSVDPWSLFASLQLPKELYETVLKTKGIVLESILEDRGVAKQGNDPALADTLVELKAVQRQLMEAVLAGKGEADTVALKKRLGDLESKLAVDGKKKGRVEDGLKASAKAVAAVIPKGGALIEFIRYRDYSAPGRFVSRYGAIVIKAGGDPGFVPLDTAENVEAGMALYAKAVRAKLEDDKMEQFLRAAGASVWDPLKPHLPAAGQQIILSPDGVLNFLSFATLLEGDKFVGETWLLSYVASGRDLLRKTDSKRNDTMKIIANPDFQTPATEEVSGQRVAGRPSAGRSSAAGGAALTMRGILGRIGLSPLPGTKAEEEALSKLIKEQWRWDIDSYLETNATEAAVNEVDSPGVLHLATHGFFLPRTGRSDALQRGQRYWDAGTEGQRATPLEAFSDVVLDNPMYRSGVALTGAEATLKQWGAGTVLDTANDGILTADEMAQLDLEGTWMVVLSACETGLGEARAGEGVLGMRRGLSQAGAQHLLLTLWPVADRETALFMMDFYTNLKAGQNSPIETAARVQAAYLKAFREQRGLTAAVKLAGPFILSFQN